MSNRFELPPELNIYSALESRDALLSWVSQQLSQSNDPLEVSARDVVEVDGAGLQLVAALSNMEQSWSLVEASPIFAEACSTLGFGHWLDKYSPKNSAGKA